MGPTGLEWPKQLRTECDDAIPPHNKVLYYFQRSPPTHVTGKTPLGTAWKNPSLLLTRGRRGLEKEAEMTNHLLKAAKLFQGDVLKQAPFLFVAFCGCGTA